MAHRGDQRPLLLFEGSAYYYNKGHPLLSISKSLPHVGPAFLYLSVYSLLFYSILYLV